MGKRPLILALIFFSNIAVAQAPAAAPEMADSLRADGKIWIVVAVLATIFAGIVAALVRTDRRISRLEKESFRNANTDRYTGQ